MKTLTTESFISRSVAIHGNKYDYSKCVYQKAQIDVIVVCRKHGEFKIRPNNHISGKQGCNKCGHKMNIFSTDEFIKNAIAVHGNEYCYKKSVYTKMNQLLVMTCSTHGDFSQTPSNHIRNKQGCNKCAGNYKSNTTDFIEKVKVVHNDKYDYSIVEYVNNHTYIDIICNDHGTFKQTPHNHLYGYGCTQCGITQMKNSQKKSLDNFIKDANDVHNSRYNYSLVNYKNARTYISITCKHHGIFKQTPDSHLRGSGCPNCYPRHSKAQIEWLDFMASLHKINIRHAENNREYKIPNTSYIADGYDGTNTIYEYHGDFWHGNPKIYDEFNINPKTKTTFGKLYENTMKKEEKIKSLGYKLITIWDSEWKNLIKSVVKLQRLFRNNRP